MDSLMFTLLCQMDIDQSTEMLRELRELTEMSTSEREIYCLLTEDAYLIEGVNTESLIESQEEIWSILN
tara:strand:+ start:1272 stop:1478 length:207 start_codon:yes stop_codon:yes gene_type:complete